MTEPLDWLPEAGLGPDPASVRELLVVRPGGLADAVRAVPALRHLRGVYEQARVTVVAPRAARDLLAACPYVDRVLDVARPSEARIEQFDVAVSFAAPWDDRGLGVEDVAARFRAGWREEGSSERGAIHPAWPERLGDGERMLRLAWLLGGSATDDALGLWPTLADRNGAARLVSGHRRPIAVLHVGAGRAARRWPAEGWARVVDLVDALGLQPVLVGDTRDRPAADTVLVEARTAPLDLVGVTSVGVLAGVLERSALFVGGDSGPAALASALGVRSIVIGPASAVELPMRAGHVDVVVAPCTRCAEAVCTHPVRDASAVGLEPVLARVGLAGATALERWNEQRLPD